MKLNCLSCGHSVDLRDDYSDYNGQVKCFVCGALLTIRTEDGLIKSVTLSSRATQSSDTRQPSMS
jgi:transcription elongation factor Elf1